MRQGTRPSWPALAVAAVALFVALGGGVYAAGRHGIDGRAVRVKSLPGNRLKVRSLPGNRLRPRSIGADRLTLGALAAAGRPAAPLTGADIAEWTLGQVPRATHAETADTARSAAEAETALSAGSAINAQRVNGHSAGCEKGTVPFAGACWQTSVSTAAVTAPQATIECAKQGGTLPEALQLAAFALQPGSHLDEGDEWSGDVTNVSGFNLYAVVTVSKTAGIDSALSSSNRHYRCVIPLVS
jgi:hypothetical protein